MSIAVCPKCHEDVSLPAASADARVRCPLCQEEFTLSEALENLPPMLIVVAGGTGGLAGGELHLEALEGSGSGGAAFNFEEAAAPQSTAPSYRETSVSLSSRPRGKEKSSLPIIQVIAGGFAAIPASILILWWGFGADPLDFAPKVSRYLPIVVPMGLRGDAGLDEEWENEAWEEEKPDFDASDWQSPNHDGAVLGGDESGFGLGSSSKDAEKTGGKSLFLPAKTKEPKESE